MPKRCSITVACCGMRSSPKAVWRSASDGAWCDEAALVGKDDSLDAVAESELHQDARDVRLDGCLADDEAGRDLGVGEAAGEELEHLELTRGQLVQLGRPRRLSRPCRELGD